MTVTIYPGRAAGAAAAPPSKSCAHRMLLCGALAEGESVIEGITPSQDMLATVDCIRAMGGACRLEGDTAYITGTGGHIRPGGTYPCRESGSTLRFCIPPALLSGGSAVFTGTPRLMERGVGIYETILAQKGISVSRTRDAVTFSGRLTPGDYTLRGDVSSQFVTGLLLALPLLPDSSILRVLPPVESRPYIDITLDIMAAFGVRVEEREPNLFSIPGGQRYASRRAAVEGDWSNAAFLLALGRRRHRHRPAPGQSAGRPGVPRYAAPAGKPRRGVGHLRLPRSGAHTVRCGGAELRRRVHRNPPPAHQGE